MSKNVHLQLVSWREDRKLVQHYRNLRAKTFCILGTFINNKHLAVAVFRRWIASVTELKLGIGNKIISTR